MARVLKRKESAFLIIISIIVFAGLFYHFGLFPARASNDLIKIFPGSFIAPPADVSGKEVPELGWQNTVAAFSQDLSAAAGFKEFNQENSAYIFSENLSEAISAPLESPSFLTGFTATPPAEGTSFTTPPQAGIKSILEIFGFGISDDLQESEIRNAQLRFSLAAKSHETDTEQNTKPDAKLLIKYQSDGEMDWQRAGEIIIDKEISNALNGGYFLYALPIFESWQDLENLRIRFTYQNIQHPTSRIQYPVYLDAVWLEVEYEEVKEEILPPEIAGKKNFRLDEEPEFIFPQKGVKAKPKVHQARLRLPNGEEGVADYLLEEVGGDYKLKLNLPRSAAGGQPGKYFIKLEVEKGGKIYYLEQEFTWGVLAINTNKSIYLSAEALAKADLPPETAYLQMAVLDDNGHTICDANLKLEITSPSGEPFSAAVQRSGQCGPNNVTDAPDYFAYYRVGGAGVYEMKLANLDNGYEIEDSFEVRESVPFEVERIGPTRIYPPSEYQMTLRIKANQDFVGEVIEYVPNSFQILNPKSEILNKFQIRNSNNQNEKLIVWSVDWKAGETHELKYAFDAPDISPYLYLLGPLEFYE